jgi:glycolate oxidase iron-sulfur subunit
VVITASGCGTQVVDYAHLLQDDPDYATKSARVVLATRDISEVITAEAEALKALLKACPPLPESERLLAFQSPAACSTGSRFAARRVPADRGRLYADAGGRFPPVLRLGRHLLGAAAGNLAAPAGQQAARPHGRRAGGDRQRQCRLHRPPRQRHRCAGAALDRTDRRERLSA